MGTGCAQANGENVQRRGMVSSNTEDAQVHAVKTPGVKLQVITLASKLLVLNPNDRKLKLLGRYVFSLARYDLNYDVRDRARLLSTLLAGVATNLFNDTDEDIREDHGGVVLRREQVKMVLFDGKAAVVEDYFRGGKYLTLKS
jgi:hypothetical protein